MCFLLTLLFLGPRAAGVIAWLVYPGRWAVAYDTFIIPLFGLLFAPWTTLMYVFVAPAGLTGLDFLGMTVAVLLDVMSWVGGGFGYQRR